MPERNEYRFHIQTPRPELGSSPPYMAEAKITAQVGFLAQLLKGKGIDEDTILSASTDSSDKQMRTLHLLEEEMVLIHSLAIEALANTTEGQSSLRKFFLADEQKKEEILLQEVFPKVSEIEIQLAIAQLRVQTDGIQISPENNRDRLQTLKEQWINMGSPDTIRIPDGVAPENLVSFCSLEQKQRKQIIEALLKVNFDHQRDRLH